MTPDPHEVAESMRREADRIEDVPTPDQVARRLRLMAAELAEAADRLDRYVESKS